MRGIIDAGRTHVAQAVNAGMVLLYWSVCDRIRREILDERRARYGEQVAETLAGPDHGVRPRFGRWNLYSDGTLGM